MSIRQGLVAGVLGNGCAALVAFALIPFYLRLLGPDGYGLVGFLATLQGWGLLADAGLSTAMNRELARFGAGAVSGQALRNLLRSVELAYAGIGCLLAGCVLALAWPVATHWLHSRLYTPRELAQAVALMALVLGTQWMAALYRSCLLGLHRQVTVGATTGIMALLRGAATLAVLVYVRPTIGAFLWTQAALGALESLALRACLAPHLPPAAHVRASAQALRAILPFAFGVAATVSLGTVLTQLDKLLVSRLVPLDQYGYFMLAVTISSVLTVLVDPVHNLAYPRFSQLTVGAPESDLARDYHHFSQVLAVGIFPPALLVAFFAEPLLRLWTADPAAAAAAAPVLSVWVLGTALNGVMHVPYAAQLAHGWTRLAATLNVVAVACMVPALLLLVPTHGAIAAAWIWVGINALSITVGVPLMHRRILPREQWAWYARDLLMPLLACSVAALSVQAAHARLATGSRLFEALFLPAALLVLVAATLAASPLSWQFVRRRLAPTDGRRSRTV